MRLPFVAPAGLWGVLALILACSSEEKASSDPADGGEGGAGGKSSGTGGSEDPPPDTGGAGGVPPIIIDAMTPTLDECMSDLRPADSLTEVLTFETEDGTIRIRRARRPGDRPGAVGETYAYDLIRFAVESADDTECVKTASALTYEFAHHNWDERWEATTATRRYAVTEVYALTDSGYPTWIDTLTVTTASGDPVLGPVPLEPIGCYTLPYDLNACMMRPRTDSPPPGWGNE